MSTHSFEDGTIVMYEGKAGWYKGVKFTVKGAQIRYEHGSLYPDWDLVSIWEEKTKRKQAWYEAEDFKVQLMSTLGTGKENAQTYADFLQKLGKITKDEANAFSKVEGLQRQVRKGAEYWRGHGIAVVASTKGAYLAKDQSEIDSYQKAQKVSAEARLRNANQKLSVKGA